MFAIAVPSTITLSTPGKTADDVKHYATLAFSHLGDDVSKCLLTLTTAEGNVHTALFDTRGGVREQRFDSAENLAAIVAAEDEAAEKRSEHDRVVAAAQNARELKTADDTTAKDVAWDAPKPFNEADYAPTQPVEPFPPMAPAPRADYHPGD